MSHGSSTLEDTQNGTRRSPPGRNLYRAAGILDA